MGDDKCEDEVPVHESVCKDEDEHHGGHTHFNRSYLDQPFYSKVGLFGAPVMAILTAPVDLFRQMVLKLRGEEYPYYHRRYKRVPLIDDCFTDDLVCIYEADVQYKRDKLVESQIIRILRERKNECIMWYRDMNSLRELPTLCQKEKKEYNNALENYFIKYGDMSYFHNVRDVYMKQKHRIIWERRHGPIGLPSERAIQIEEETKKETNIFQMLKKSWYLTNLPKNLG